MKKIGLLLVALVIMVSCEKESNENVVVLSGKVTNNRASRDLLVNSLDNTINETIKVLEDGTFKDTLLVKNGIYVISYGRNKAQIYVEGESNLEIYFDVKDFDNTLNFVGDGAAESKYVYLKAKKLAEYEINEMDFYKLDENKFKSHFTEVKNSLEKTLDEVDGVSNKFKSKEKRNLNYGYLSMLTNYRVYHSFLTKQPDFKVSEGFLKEIDAIDYNNEDDYQFSNEYRDLVFSYYRKKSYDQLKDTKKVVAIDEVFIKTVSSVKSEIIKNGLLYNYVTTMFDKSDDKEGLYKAYMAASTSEDNNKAVTEFYNKYQMVAKGKPSPQFSNFETLNGEKVSLESFKGKMVYIYVWSATFKPSLEQVSAFNQLQEKYSNSNIAFVALSVDKDSKKDIWKETITKENFKAIHIIADNGKESEFIKSYGIAFPPKYILIDAQGNIISADAPRPSNNKLDKLFNEPAI
jgi:peroxiredoxin